MGPGVEKLQQGGSGAVQGATLSCKLFRPQKFKGRSKLPIVGSL